MNKYGFTLYEVCVAMAVFTIGTLALSYFIAGFGRVRAMESSRGQDLIQATEQMENFIANPHPCEDSLKTQGMLVAYGMVYIQVEVNATRLRRLVKCK